MWETMGPIADRTREKLGASDLAVVEFRKLMVDAARAFQQTGEVIGRTEPHVPHASIASFEAMLPKTGDWRKFTASPAAESSVESGPKERVA
jgi:phthalate 4,5-dioxygenase oxygenase subunit